ncbi:interferon-induced very large GTPase 1-like isoform X2 [Mercenaria mercenaria]|uniref:interferon-induced very large GTPase 1-like isoform X2 n=1 Tax=Mercenaria mercenaria TaxID=6596 RepID=UPI00234E7F37|nr:interferon-induced very large GTPase 1-like isoform X2 [Mercenaria mercenaria]
MGVDIETYRGRIGTFKFAFGTDVITVECLINFSHGLKTVGSLAFIGLLLVMAGIESNPGPKDSEDGKDIDMGNVIQVTGIPPHVDEDYLVLVFKNAKKQGGGKVKTVQLDRQTRIALIEFEDPSAVQTVLDKRPIKIANTEVEVRPLAKAESCTIEVEGFAMNDSIKELLELYFEDSSGGEPVVETRILGEGKALVTFESPEVARGVVEKENHTLSQQELTVTFYNETEVSTQSREDKIVSEETNAADTIPENTETEISTKPIYAEPLSNGTIQTDPVLTESEPAKSLETERIHTEQEATAPLLTDPSPTEKVSTEQVSSQPSPTESVCSKPLDTESWNTEPEYIAPFPNNTASAETEQKQSDTLEPYSVPGKTAVPTEHLKNVPVFTETIPTEPIHTEPPHTDHLSAELEIPEKQLSDTEPSELESIDSEPNEHEFTHPNETVVEKVLQSDQVPSETLLREMKSEKRSEAIKEDIPIGQFHNSDTHGVNIDDIEVQVLLNETEQTGLDKSEVLNENEEKDSFTVHQVLETLGLVDKYPEKIKVEDVLSIPLTNKKASKTSEVPWVLLRQILAVQSHARDTCLVGIEDEKVHETSCKVAGDFDFIDESTTSNELSPLDVFNVTIQCCDNMLKQLLFKKLYLCKIAVPFVHIDRLSLQNKISVWPFRSIVVNSKVSVDKQEHKSNETELLELPVKTITFARFGRTQCSKSKLINDLISEQIHDTFFNVDCPSGMARRIFSNGTIEMFCLPTVGNKNDRFSDAVSVFNMRGDIESDFHTDVLTLVSQMSESLVLIIDKLSLEMRADSLSNFISRFPSVVLVVDSPVNAKDKETLKKLKDHLNSPLTPVGTHKGVAKKNSKEIIANVKEVIVSFIENSIAKSVENRLNSITTALEVDENGDSCVKGKSIASSLFETMSEIEDKCKWKESVTPVNYIYSQKLGTCIKRLYRLKNVDEIGSVESEIKSVRTKQLKNVTSIMQMFISILTDNIQNVSTMQYMFGWLSYFVDRQKRLILPQLIQENLSCWKTLAVLKKNGQSLSDLELKRQVELTEASQKRIEDASLGIEHLFREVGHIYDAVLNLDKTFHPADIPSSTLVIEAVASLVVHGQPFELVDGDSFYMPTRWVDEVLQKVSSKIEKKAILVLSVLGLQSSGKSTLLNAMFGSQFPVKSGRCTRGIHMQLLPCTSDLRVELPFDFILVIDTEGLRAPEINPNRPNHDNELSTVITGLGDVTFLNIMGENTSEIRDILQVVVHAFLRLKLVKKTVDFGKNFYLLHQNVVDISASENMRTGLQVLMETLDTVTKEAAETEGIRDITTFNQVIEFDMTSNVWYLPNFWQGNPPMARVNSGYSDRLLDEKTKLLETAFSKTNKSYQTVKDVAVHMQDLWKGVLTEDFVFSFRNSLEIKAYVQLEETLKESLIKLEDDVDEKRITFSQEEFSKCEKQNQLQDACDEIIIQIQKALAENESVAKECMTNFFENNEYKDTIIQWKEFTYNRIRLHCSELEDSMKLETMRLRDKTAVDILTAESSKEHKKELYDRSLRVAKETKGTNLSEQEIDMKFEETWENILREIMNVGISSNTIKSVRDCIIKCLFDIIFNTEKLILKTELEKKGIFPHDAENVETGVFPVTSISHLKGSFTNTGISNEDISFSIQSPNSAEAKLMTVAEKINYLFEAIDLYVTRCCQGDMEITYREVKNVLLKTKHEVEVIRKGNNEFTLKTTAVVKLFIHVSSFVQTKFDEHNTNYQKSNGVQARLEMYKLQVKEHFVSYIKDRKAEETAAKQICIITENILHEKVKERLPVAVKSALLNSMTHLKFHLILEMLQDMTNNDDFDSFIDYIKHPKLFAEKWITKKSEKLLFDPATKKYSEVASTVVTEFYDALRGSAKASEEAFELETPTIETWLKFFTSNFPKCTFSSSSFSDIYKILEKIEDMKNFLSVLIEQIDVSECNLKEGFEEQTSVSVTWSGQNPYESLIQKAWGCPEQCAFCGEPCAKDTNHAGMNHYSLQHRLSCCKGVRNSWTKEASITSCNYDVHSDQIHTCGVFDFLCNPSEHVECSEHVHSYKEYRKFLPNWDIEPNPNMQDCGKFWLWFVATYKQKLAAHFEYDVSNVPSTWDEITKEEALEAKQLMLKSYSV